MGSPSSRTMIKIVIVLILIGLNIALLLNGLKWDCNECTVNFVNNQVSGVILEEPFEEEIKGQELYDEFDEGDCMIKFDRVHGYYLT